MSLSLKLIKIPKMLLPKSALDQATRIAKDFTTFVESVADGYNESNGTTITAAEGLVKLMDTNTTFQTILDENPEKADFVKKAITAKWSGQKGYGQGWRVVNARWAKWWLYNILTPYRPDLGKAIIEHPKGEKWIEEFVVGFRKMLWGK